MSEINKRVKLTNKLNQAISVNLKDNNSLVSYNVKGKGSIIVQKHQLSPHVSTLVNRGHLVISEAE